MGKKKKKKKERRRRRQPQDTKETLANPLPSAEDVVHNTASSTEEKHDPYDDDTKPSSTMSMFQLRSSITTLETSTPTSDRKPASARSTRGGKRRPKMKSNHKTHKNKSRNRKKNDANENDNEDERKSYEEEELKDDDNEREKVESDTVGRRNKGAALIPTVTNNDNHPTDYTYNEVRNWLWNTRQQQQQEHNHPPEARTEGEEEEKEKEREKYVRSTDADADDDDDNDDDNTNTDDDDDDDDDHAVSKSSVYNKEQLSLSSSSVSLNLGHLHLLPSVEEPSGMKTFTHSIIATSSVIINSKEEDRYDYDEDEDYVFEDDEDGDTTENVTKKNTSVNNSDSNEGSVHHHPQQEYPNLDDIIGIYTNHHPEGGGSENGNVDVNDSIHHGDRTSNNRPVAAVSTSAAMTENKWKPTSMVRRLFQNQSSCSTTNNTTIKSATTTAPSRQSSLIEI